MMIEIKSHHHHEERVENAWMKLEMRAWLLLIINVTKQLLPMWGSFVYRSIRPNVSLAPLPCLQNFLHQNDWEPSFTMQKQIEVENEQNFCHITICSTQKTYNSDILFGSKVDWTSERLDSFASVTSGRQRWCFLSSVKKTPSETSEFLWTGCQLACDKWTTAKTHFSLCKLFTYFPGTHMFLGPVCFM